MNLAALGTAAVLYGAAHLLGFVTWLALARRWLRATPTPRWDFGIAALVVFAIVVVFAWGVDPGAIPTHWITALQEGRTQRSILHLYASSTHAGPNWYGLIAWIRASPGMDARAIVHMNLCLATLNTVLVAVALRAIVAHRIVAALLTIGWAVSANRINAACSELPSELLTTYFLLGLLPVAVFQSEATPRRSFVAVLTIANVACWASLAALTRQESVGIGAPAVLAMLLRVAVRDEVIDRLAVRYTAWVRAHPWVCLPTLYLASVATDRAEVYARTLTSAEARWALESFRFWWPMRTALPAVLSDFLPLPIVVAMIVGLLLALRRPLRTALLPLTVFGVWAVYQRASHEAPYERFRYVSMLTAPLVVLAAFGARDAEALLAARPAWRRPAAWGLALLGVLSVLPGGPGRSVLSLHAAVAGEREQGILLARNKQIAVRYLLNATTAHPECVFVARASSRPENPGTPPVDLWAFFGHPLRYPIFVPVEGRTLHAAIRETITDAPCVLYYRSMDCSLVRARGECDADTVGAEVLDRRVLVSRPYSDATEYGALSREVVLGLFRLPGGQR